MHNFFLHKNILIFRRFFNSANRWRITNITKESIFISFMVNNTSTIQSGTRPPVIGYTDFWQKNIGSPLNKAFESGPMSKTSQTFKWTEKVKL